MMVQSRCSISALQSSPEETRVTAAGQVVGSIAYMSPEQLQGIDVDHRSDIWSYGVVLYEMLTLHFPFRGDHAAAVVYSIANEDPPPPDTLRNGVPLPLADVCMSCLRKEPAERPDSMGTVLSILAGISRPKPEKRRTVTRIPSFWRPAATALGTIAVLAILALAVPDVRTGIDRIFRGGTNVRRIMVVLPFTPIDSSGESRSSCAGLSWMVPSRLAELMKGGRIGLAHRVCRCKQIRCHQFHRSEESARSIACRHGRYAAHRGHRPADC